MRNGLYKVEFQTQLGAGFGVVHMLDGRLRGGDSSIYYVGTYTVDGDALKLSVDVDRHSQTDIGSVLGIDRAHIDIDATVAGDTATGTGSSPQAPGISFGAILTRIAD